MLVKLCLLCCGLSRLHSVYFHPSVCCVKGSIIENSHLSIITIQSLQITKVTSLAGRCPLWCHYFATEIHIISLKSMTLHLQSHDVKIKTYAQGQITLQYAIQNICERDHVKLERNISVCSLIYFVLEKH